MDKEKCKLLNTELKALIEQGNYNDATLVYNKILDDMSDLFNSYQSKLDEYFRFLTTNREYIPDYSDRIEAAVSSILTKELSSDDKYSICMMAGFAEENTENYKKALYWYELCEKMFEDGLIASNRSQKKIRRINKLLEEKKADV